MIYMSYAEWDPSGKLLLTASNNTKTFMIWNSFGNMIFKDTFLKELSFIQWRPRPRFQIPERQLKDIQNDFASIVKKYEDQDDKILNKAKHEQEAKMKAMEEEFMTYMKAKRALYDNTRQDRVKLRGFDEEHNRTETLIVEVEHIKESKEI